MRIIAGECRNRRLAVPAADVRPAADRVREAVFSMLGPWIKDKQVLDLYAGTGAYGLESLSRGAARAVFVEQDPKVIETLAQNIQRCGVGPEQGVLCRESVEAYCSKSFRGAPFDLVFADPPYRESSSGILLQNTLQVLEGRTMVHPDGFLLFEQQKNADPVLSDGWDLLRDRTYGTSRILLYRRKGL